MVNFFHSSAFTWDRVLLETVNSHNSPFLDVLMWAVSSHWFGFLFFAVMSALVIISYRRPSWKVLLVIALAVCLSDLLCARVIKPSVRRPRPTHDTESFGDYDLHLHQRDDGTFYSGGAYGFPSNHSANFMAMAIMFAFFLKPKLRHYRSVALFAFLTVFLVGYSRVYLAVHYPSDVIAGWLIASAVSFAAILVIPGQYKNRKNRQ